MKKIYSLLIALIVCNVMIAESGGPTRHFPQNGSRVYGEMARTGCCFGIGGSGLICEKAIFSPFLPPLRYEEVIKLFAQCCREGFPQIELPYFMIMPDGTLAPIIGNPEVPKGLQCEMFPKNRKPSSLEGHRNWEDKNKDNKLFGKRTNSTNSNR